MVSFARLDMEDVDQCWSSMLALFACGKEDVEQLADHPLNFASNMKSLEVFIDVFFHEDPDKMLPRVCANSVGRLHVEDQKLWCRVELAMLPTYMKLASELPRVCRYSESIEVFLSCCEGSPLPEDMEAFRDFCKRPAKYFSLACYDQFRSYVERFYRRLHQRLRDPKTRRKIIERRRSVNRTCQRVCEYVVRLFDTCARLVVLRVDLGYREGRLRSVESSVKDVDRLFANMRNNSLFRGLHGYIVKVEYGVQKGVHFHLMLFFDGSKRGRFSDRYLGQQIGEYWRDVVVKGDGQYWNANARKHEYEARGLLGIGVVHADQVGKRRNLMRVVGYLCKAEQFVKPIAQPKAKMVRTGKWPELAFPRRGAPRKNQREMECSSVAA